MIIRNGAGASMFFRKFVLANWLPILAIFSLEVLIGEINRYSPGFQTTVFSAGSVSMLATVVGIFLVFRFNNAYQRWWEARTLWGQLVNVSRNFGRQVTTLLSAGRVTAQLNAEQLGPIHRSLLLRQVAYVNALRLSLRQQGGWGELSRFLDTEELRELVAVENKPAWLLQRQGEQLSELLGPDTSAQILLTHMDAQLNQVFDIQGGCERIKNTAFPDMVKYMSRLFVWAIALLVPAVFLEPDQSIYPVEFAAVLVISLSFFIVHQLAVSLMNPFDNDINDTPMSALCLTIERDLRQQLGETELPPALQPRNGILM